MQPNKEQVELLLKNSMVQAWIKNYYSTRYLKRPPNCNRCGWPHAEVLMCGSGAWFGTFTLCKKIFSVDASNVEWTIEFFNDLGNYGFHWRDSIFFDIQSDCVIVTYFESYNNCPQKKQWSLPLLEWRSIVDFIERKHIQQSRSER